MVYDDEKKIQDRLEKQRKLKSSAGGGYKKRENPPIESEKNTNKNNSTKEDKEQKILNRLEKQRSLKNFASGAFSQSKENEKLSSKNKMNRSKKYLGNSAKAINAVKQSKSLATAYSAVDFSKDAPYLIIIVFSILADLFTLIPLFGNIFALIFSVFFWVYYLISGHYKNRATVKIAITGLATFLEIFGFALNMLPFFTTSALINYWLILGERKSKQTQK